MYIYIYMVLLCVSPGEDQLLVSVAIADKVSGSKSSKKKSSLSESVC